MYITKARARGHLLSHHRCSRTPNPIGRRPGATDQALRTLYSQQGASSEKSCKTSLNAYPVTRSSKEHVTFVEDHRLRQKEEPGVEFGHSIAISSHSLNIFLPAFRVVPDETLRRDISRGPPQGALLYNAFIRACAGPVCVQGLACLVAGISMPVTRILHC